MIICANSFTFGSVARCKAMLLSSISIMLLLAAVDRKVASSIVSMVTMSFTSVFTSSATSSTVLSVVVAVSSVAVSVLVQAVLSISAPAVNNKNVFFIV